MTLTGTSGGSTSTDGTGFYQFGGLAFNGNYTITPSKARRAVGSPGINTVDVVAEQNHALNRVLLTGCRLAAGEAAGPAGINTVDVLAIQAFALGRTIPAQIGNVGTHVFSPASRAVTLSGSQTNQNFDTIILGDVANPIASPPPRPGGPAPDAPEVGPVALVKLPDIASARSTKNLNAAVTTTFIDASSNLVGFQADFIFDERAITFDPNQPVQPAGLTARNWNVSGNILSGKGPIRTLRISAFSEDFAPLSGKGTLFELRVSNVSSDVKASQTNPSVSPDDFYFIDADLHVTKPGYARPGSVGR